MPYLYCEHHGREHAADARGNEARYREADESVLIVHGTLISGPWVCDRCNAPLNEGDSAWLVSAFPAHFHDSLHDYDFGYEREYFAMTKGDQATAYGAAWPDDSIRNRRIADDTKPRRHWPLAALDLFKK